MPVQTPAKTQKEVSAADSPRPQPPGRSQIPVTGQVSGIESHLDLAAAWSRLLAAGYSARIQEMAGDKGLSFFRLWIGRFSDAGEAEAFARKFRTKERQTLEVVSATPLAEARSTYAVEVFSGSTSEEDIWEMAARLRNSGYSAALQPAVPGTAGKLEYVIWIGHFENRREAEAFSTRLYKNEGLRSVVVKRPAVSPGPPSFTVEITVPNEQAAREAKARLPSAPESAQVNIRQMNGLSSHRIWSGRFSSAAEAEEEALRLKEAGFSDLLIRQWR